ncbi:conserved hypothetical protein [Lebetimonas natsushimae]|uniref:WbqC-like protein family protein n=1 Tax=Lebetimonas natsushimae TaxID=1936991 RepID=A0A292YE69_9BACT|nr:WbqC family protein [Lebetimonas natsushimae]GAX87593.1 conserved hypothetical protein [Lebetimonas natsushimae]
MKIAIMQPTYNPWLGYFDLMDKVDIFVYLDDVKLVKGSWHVRNRIKASNSEMFLTIPINIKTSSKKTLINNAEIKETNWRKKHIKSIEQNYRKSKFYDIVFPFVKKLILNDFNVLGNFNINFIENIKEIIGITTKTIKSSELNVLGQKDERLVKICKKLNANIYLSPQGSAEYIEAKTPGGEFIKNGIKLFYHNYEHPIYNQLYGEFLPYMGIIDLLFNEGFENALEIIRSGRKKDFDYKEFRKIKGIE